MKTSRLLVQWMAIIGGVLIVSMSGQAALLASEQFVYPEGTTIDWGNMQGGIGWLGGGASWYNAAGPYLAWATNGSLAYPANVTYTTNGNMLAGVDNGQWFGKIGRNLDAAGVIYAGTPATRYISFLINVNTLGKWSQMGLGKDGNDNAFFNFGIDSTFRMESGSAFGGGSVTYGTAVVNTNYMLVAKIVNDGTSYSASANFYGATDTVPGTEGAWSLTFPAVANNGINIDRVYGYKGNVVTVLFDELRIGETYEDVVQVVPEPATLTLLGAALLLLRRRIS